MSTTPRTDEQIRLHKFFGEEGLDMPFADFARKLELENIKLQQELTQTRLDLVEARRQHQQEMDECKSDENLIAENIKLLEVARAAKKVAFAPSQLTRFQELHGLDEALKSLEESGICNY